MADGVMYLRGSETRFVVMRPRGPCRDVCVSMVEGFRKPLDLSMGSMTEIESRTSPALFLLGFSRYRLKVILFLLQIERDAQRVVDLGHDGGAQDAERMVELAARDRAQLHG